MTSNSMYLWWYKPQRYCSGTKNLPSLTNQIVLSDNHYHLHAVMKGIWYLILIILQQDAHSLLWSISTEHFVFNLPIQAHWEEHASLSYVHVCQNQVFCPRGGLCTWNAFFFNYHFDLFISEPSFWFHLSNIYLGYFSSFSFSSSIMCLFFPVSLLYPVV